jgi:ribosome-binding protein aMBF1 (putative translation factor)
MAKRKPKKPTFSDQVRNAINNSGMTIYRLAEETGVEASVLYRFVSGKRGFTTATLDKVSKCLGLELKRPKTKKK